MSIFTGGKYGKVVRGQVKACEKGKLSGQVFYFTEFEDGESEHYSATQIDDLERDEILREGVFRRNKLEEDELARKKILVALQEEFKKRKRHQDDALAAEAPEARNLKRLRMVGRKKRVTKQEVEQQDKKSDRPFDSSRKGPKENTTKKQRPYGWALDDSDENQPFILSTERERLLLIEREGGMKLEVFKVGFEYMVLGSGKVLITAPKETVELPSYHTRFVFGGVAGHYMCFLSEPLSPPSHFLS